MPFEEIFSCLVDEDEDYRSVNDEGLTSTLDSVALGLVIAGQPLSPFKEAGFTEPPPVESRTEEPPAADEEPKGDPKVSVGDKRAGEVNATIVDQTLIGILDDSNPSLPKIGLSIAAS